MNLESRISRLEQNPPSLSPFVEVEDPVVELGRILHNLFTAEYGREMLPAEFTALCAKLEEHDWEPGELLSVVRSVAQEPSHRRYVRRLRAEFASYCNVREEIEAPGFRVDSISGEVLDRALKEGGLVMGWPLTNQELVDARRGYAERAFSQGAGVDPVEFLVYVCSRVDLSFDTFRRECL
jgi:hypothetical protein